MATYNTALQNAFCDTLQSAFGGGSCELRNASGTALATITLPATAFGSPSGGSVEKAGDWAGTVASSGTAATFRLVGDSGEEMDGTVGAQGSGADMEITNNIDGVDDTELVAGNDVEVTNFTFTQPGE